MKVLVTGASGFIGRECCAQLNAMGYEVHGVSSKFQSDDIVHWHKANLLDSQQSINLLRNIQPTHLLHLAWYTEPGRYWTSVKNYHWVKASLTLFEEFVESGGKRIVVAGSCAEYDWGFENYSEDVTPLNPATLYGVCKHSLHWMLSSYAALRGLSFVWGRVFSIYGPHENTKRLFPSIIQALLQGRKITCNNGNLIRDYLHVNDVASAFIALLLSDSQGPVNIGSGCGIKLRDIVEKIETRIGNDNCLEISNTPAYLNDAPIIVADVSRLNDIGWRPTYDIESGLDHTIDWFSDN